MISRKVSIKLVTVFENILLVYTLFFSNILEAHCATEVFDGVIKRYGSYFCIIKLDFNLYLISFISTEARFISFLHVLRIVY